MIGHSLDLENKYFNLQLCEISGGDEGKDKETNHKSRKFKNFLNIRDIRTGQTPLKGDRDVNCVKRMAM